MKRRAIEVLVGGLFLVVALTAMLSLGLANRQPSTVSINGSKIEVTVADSDDERVRGLSGTPQLEDGTGMLFIFDESSYHGIWMKDMKYPIDIIWLDEDRKIVHLEEFATPESYPERTFTPQVPAKYVLEMPVGSIKSYGMNNGRSFTFDL